MKDKNKTIGTKRKVNNKRDGGAKRKKETDPSCNSNDLIYSSNPTTLSDFQVSQNLKEIEENKKPDNSGITIQAPESSAASSDLEKLTFFNIMKAFFYTEGKMSTNMYSFFAMDMSKSPTELFREVDAYFQLSGLEIKKKQDKELVPIGKLFRTWGKTEKNKNQVIYGSFATDSLLSTAFNMDVPTRKIALTEFVKFYNSYVEEKNKVVLVDQTARNEEHEIINLDNFI